MKRIISLISIATSAFALLSCSKAVEEEIIEEKGRTYSYTFAVANGDAAGADAETKSVLGSDANGLFLQWENTDKLNTWALYTGGSGAYSYNNQSSVNASTNPVTFTIVSYRALAKDDTIYAMYPYTGTSDKTPTTNMTIPATQTQTGTSFDASAMPMVAEPFGISAAVSAEGSNDETSKVHFYNLGSIVEFDIYSSTGAYSSESIKSVSFTSTSNIAGTFSFDLTTVDASNLATSLSLAGKSYSVKSVTTNVSGLSVGDATGVANAKKVYMVLAPGSYTGTITVTTDVANYKYPISVAKDFNRASVKRLGIDLEKDDVRTIIMTISGDNFPTGGYKTGTLYRTVLGSKYSIAYTKAYKNGGIQLQASNGEFHNTSSMGKILSIQFKNVTNSANVYFGTSANPSTAATTSGGKYVPNDSNDNGYFKISVGSTYAVIDNVVIEFEPLAGADFAWKNSSDVVATSGSGTITYGSPNVVTGTPSFYNPNSIDVSDITFTSTDTDVATVSDAGVVSIAGAGETTIKASFDGDATYAPFEASYTLTVSDITYRSITKTGTRCSIVTSVSGSPVTTAKAGDVVTITATPTVGTDALSSMTVTKAGSGSVEVSENTFVMPADAVTVEVVYVETYVITIAYGTDPANGTAVAKVGGATVTRAASGATVSITATPVDSDHVLSALKYNDGTDHDIKSTKSFTMPAKAVTVTATFAEKGDVPDPVTVNTYANVATVSNKGKATETASWTNGDITVLAQRNDTGNTTFRTTETTLTRFYSGWTINVTSAANTISSLEITCDDSTYASNLAGYSFTNGSATAKGDVVTVSGVSASTTAVTLGAQTRIKSIKVNYVSIRRTAYCGQERSWLHLQKVHEICLQENRS